MPSSSPRVERLRPLRAKRVRSKDDLATWRALHFSDDDSMYRLPSSDQKLLAVLRRANAHLAFDGVGCLIGGFTITPVGLTVASVGLVVTKDLRGGGIGKTVLRLAEQRAEQLGFLTLRADVYCDNTASLKLLRGAGYRDFVWLEKNVADGTE